MMNVELKDFDYIYDLLILKQRMDSGTNLWDISYHFGENEFYFLM